MVSRTFGVSPSAPSTVTSVTVEAQRVGDGGDAEVGRRRCAPAPSSIGRDVGDDLVDEAGARNAAARVGPPSRKTCWRSRRVAARRAPRAGRGCAGARSRRASSRTRRSAGEVALPHHHAQRLVARSGRSSLVADGERGSSASTVPVPTRIASHSAAQPVGVAAGGGAGDPPAGAVGGGAAAVEGGGELPGDEGPAVLDGEGPGPVERAAPRRRAGRASTSTPAARSVSAPPAATGLGSALGEDHPAYAGRRPAPGRTGRCGRCGCRARG